MAKQLYCFTEDQLRRVLGETLGLFNENQEKHGQHKMQAFREAVTGTIDGLDAEAELIAAGEKIKPTFKLVKENSETALPAWVDNRQTLEDLLG